MYQTADEILVLPPGVKPTMKRIADADSRAVGVGRR